MQMHIHSMHDAMISLRRSFIRSIPTRPAAGKALLPYAIHRVVGVNLISPFLEIQLTARILSLP